MSAKVLVGSTIDSFGGEDFQLPFLLGTTIFCMDFAGMKASTLTQPDPLWFPQPTNRPPPAAPPIPAKHAHLSKLPQGAAPCNAGLTNGDPSSPLTAPEDGALGVERRQQRLLAAMAATATAPSPPVVGSPFESPCFAQSLPLPSLPASFSGRGGGAPVPRAVDRACLARADSQRRLMLPVLGDALAASLRSLRHPPSGPSSPSRGLSPRLQRHLSRLRLALGCPDPTQLASLRRCHRLRRPEDAFTLGGPEGAMEDTLSIRRGGAGAGGGGGGGAGGGGAGGVPSAFVGAAMASSSRPPPPAPPPRRKRPDRSFLALEEGRASSKARATAAGGMPTGSSAPTTEALQKSLRGSDPGDGQDSCKGRSEGGRGGPPFSRAGKPRKDGDNNSIGGQPALVSVSSSVPRTDEEHPEAESTLESGEMYEETLSEKRERIEREIMNYYKHMHNRRKDAAGVLQKAWRCSCARAELHKRQQILYAHIYIRQKAAALCIAGFLRMIVLQKKRLVKQAEHTTHNAARAEVERQHLRSVRVIERAVRRWLTTKHERDRLCALLHLTRDSRLREYTSAARTIQLWWPQAVWQRAYWRERREQLAVQREREAAAALLDAAATQIQRIVRGRRCRWAVQHYRVQRAHDEAMRRLRLAQRTDLLLVVLREYAARQERARVMRAREEAQSAVAESLLRDGLEAALTRRRLGLVLAHTRRLQRAAACIQRAWRRFHAGRERRYLRELQYTTYRERVDAEAREYTAVLRLQAFARMVLAKVAKRRQRAAHGRAVLAGRTLLGRVGRGYLARRVLGQRRSAEMLERAKAEAELAAHQNRSMQIAQLFMRAKRSSCITEQRRRQKYLDTAHLQALVRDELRREAAAVCIQRAIRRHWRRQAERKVQQEAAHARAWVLRSIVQLQSWWRTCLAKQKTACRRAQVDWLSQRRLEFEEVRNLLEEELKEKGAQHLFYYHEGCRACECDFLVDHHRDGVEAEEMDDLLEASWARIYEDD